MQKTLETVKSLFESKADMHCVVETWLSEHNMAIDVPGYTALSLPRPSKQRGPVKVGICVYVAEHMSECFSVWKTAADRSYV